MVTLRVRPKDEAATTVEATESVAMAEVESNVMNRGPTEKSTWSNAMPIREVAITHLAG